MPKNIMYKKLLYMQEQQLRMRLAMRMRAALQKQSSSFIPNSQTWAIKALHIGQLKC